MPTPDPRPREVVLARERDDIHVFHIKRSELAAALRRLRQHSVVRLGLSEFRRLAQNSEPNPDRYLYLARAGVQTPLNMPEERFFDLAENASYRVTDRGEPNGFKLVSLMMSGFEADRRNYAILLASPDRIPDLRVYCLGGT